MFGDQGRPARQQAMKVLMNSKMVEGTPVREHLLKMFDSLNVLEVLGAEIDGESQVDIILESLPESFNNFKLNYGMNKLSLSLSELMSSLQAAEGIIKTTPAVHNTEKSSSRFKPYGKNQKKKGKGGPKTSGEKPSTGGGKKAKPGAGGKCFHCNGKGHWKRNCPVLMEKSKKTPGMTLSPLLK